MHVLVTGATGFVGRVLVHRLLDAGHQVVALARRPSTVDFSAEVETVSLDLRDRDATVSTLAQREFDAVCHLAARTRVRESLEDPLGYYRTNVSGSVNLLEAVGASSKRHRMPLRFVYASTAAVYGPQDVQPIPEDAPVRPTSPYGASKLAVDYLLQHEARNAGLACVSLRCFNAAGAWGPIHDQDETRLIPKALAVAAGLAAAVPVNGDGSSLREYTHVIDLADAYICALSKATPGQHAIFNVGSSHAITINDLLTEVEEVTGRKLVIDRRPPQPEPSALVADSTRLREEYGWLPQRSDIRTMLADAWNSLRSSRLEPADQANLGTATIL